MALDTHVRTWCLYQIDENYEPTEEELDEYARWLGMDPTTERKLLWIAREGLKAPLPKEWKPWCVTCR